MKIVKRLIAAAMVLPMLAGVTACKDEFAEYSAPEQLSQAQVFFPVTNSQTVELPSLDGSYSISISRVDSTQALNVPFTVTCSSDKYTIPTSVQFTEGQKDADITFTYANLEYDDFDTITVALPDDIANPYGVQKYTFVVGCPAPWTPWCYTKGQWVNAGMDPEAWPLSQTATTCTYTYSIIFTGNDTDLPISYRQSTLDPEAAQIRIENWCNGETIILDYNPTTKKIYIEPQFTGFTDDGVGDFYLTDVTHWQGREIAGYESYYDPTTGLISLCTAWMANEDHASCYGYGYEYIQLDGFYIPNYEFSATMEGILTDVLGQPNALVNIANIGQDVEAIKAYIVASDVDPSAVADALAAGDVEGVDIVEGNNRIAIDSELSGSLIVVLAGITEGEVVNVKALPFEFYGSGNASPWKNLGIGLFQDDIILPNFTEDGSYDAWEVQIQESTETPGLYRLIDPYGPGVNPYYEALQSVGVQMPGKGKYLYINACKSNGVYIEHQSLGIDWGKGDCGFVTEAAMYLSNYPIEEIIEAGLTGKVQDGIITFPAFYVLDENDQPTEDIYQGYLTLNGQLAYYSGFNGKVSVLLPEAYTPAQQAKHAVARHFSLNAKMGGRGISKQKRVSRILGTVEFQAK